MRTVKIENGKYEFDLDDAGIMIAARRNGEPWSAGMEFRFAKCFMSMLWELEESRAAHNAGAREPVAYLHEMHMEGDQMYERLTFDITNAFGEPGRDYSESYEVTCTPLYDHPQPMTDAARDAEDAKRYRFIKSKMQVGAVQTQLPLYRTLHWIGYEDCSDVRDADAAIDAEIERGEREGEHETR